MIRLALILAAVLAAGPSFAESFEIGYGLVHARGRSASIDSARSAELRFNVGNRDGSGRYSGDRIAIAIGYINDRNVAGPDNWIKGPDGLAEASTFDSYRYVSAVHRWYGAPAWAPKTRFFVGTGIAYRDAETCVQDPELGRLCFEGTPLVSSAWTFHQSIGLKWRETLELAVEHDSTGRISRLNTGDDQLRLSLFARF